MGTLAEQNRGRVWGNTFRVIVMARQQAQSSKDNDPGCHVWTVRNVGALFCSEKAAGSRDR
jgi:hypothetical protein